MDNDLPLTGNLTGSNKSEDLSFNLVRALTWLYKE